MIKLTALTKDPHLEQEFQRAHIPNVTLCRAASADDLYARVNQEPKGIIVLLDLDLPEGMSGLALVEKLRKRNPDIAAIILTPEQPRAETWLEAARKPFVELMRIPINPGELQFHLSRLSSFQLQRAEPTPLKTAPVEALRNNKTGRLDVNKISDVFGITVADISRCIDRPRQTLVKTPDSVSIQKNLQPFERIARGLMVVTGSSKGLKMWLNSPNPDFENHTPLDVLKLGKAELLAGWVDDARLGSPD